MKRTKLCFLILAFIAAVALPAPASAEGFFSGIFSKKRSSPALDQYQSARYVLLRYKMWRPPASDVEPVLGADAIAEVYVYSNGTFILCEGRCDDSSKVRRGNLDDIGLDVNAKIAWMRIAQVHKHENTPAKAGNVVGRPPTKEALQQKARNEKEYGNPENAKTWDALIAAGDHFRGKANGGSGAGADGQGVSSADAGANAGSGIDVGAGVTESQQNTAPSASGQEGTASETSQGLPGEEAANPADDVVTSRTVDSVEHDVDGSTCITWHDEQGNTGETNVTPVGDGSSVVSTIVYDENGNYVGDSGDVVEGDGGAGSIQEGDVYDYHNDGSVTKRGEGEGDGDGEGEGEGSLAQGADEGGEGAAQEDGKKGDEGGGQGSAQGDESSDDDDDDDDDDGDDGGEKVAQQQPETEETEETEGEVTDTTYPVKDIGWGVGGGAPQTEKGKQRARRQVEAKRGQTGIGYNPVSDWQSGAGGTPDEGDVRKDDGQTGSPDDPRADDGSPEGGGTGRITLGLDASSMPGFGVIDAPDIGGIGGGDGGGSGGGEGEPPPIVGPGVSLIDVLARDAQSRQAIFEWVESFSAVR